LLQTTVKFSDINLTKQRLWFHNGKPKALHSLDCIAWRAPETFQRSFRETANANSNLMNAETMYRVGLLFNYMLSGKRQYEGLNEKEIVSAMQQFSPILHQPMDFQCGEIIFGCLTSNDCRMTTQQIIQKLDK